MTDSTQSGLRNKWHLFVFNLRPLCKCTYLRKCLKFSLMTTWKSVQHEFNYKNLLFLFAVAFCCYEQTNQIAKLWSRDVTAKHLSVTLIIVQCSLFVFVHKQCLCACANCPPKLECDGHVYLHGCSIMLTIVNAKPDVWSYEGMEAQAKGDYYSSFITQKF